jgi:alanyl-tRNA synthetase
MNSTQLRQKFLDFMSSKGHAILPSGSLVPKEDPTVLFTTAGMQPLIPYLTGSATHPAGSRLANSQKCLRTDDIDEVGDNRHLTFFEMLGNWSLGDYFKKESIQWTFEFLTSKSYLGLDPNRLYATVYKGSEAIGADQESLEIWTEMFHTNYVLVDSGVEFNFKNPSSNLINQKFIYKITMKSGKDNWWGLPYRGPCGSCTEVYYLKDDQPLDFRESILPNLSLEETEQYLENNLVEIWNNVFMEFEGEKTAEKEPINLKPLKTKNVDTGVGFERLLTFLNHKQNVFETDLFSEIIQVVEKYKNL